jgi:stage III sporulation protein AD
MDIFVKAVAGILIAVVMCLILSKHGKDYAVILVICVCCMVAASAMGFLQHVFAFVDKLQSIGDLNSELMEILFKTVGIGLLSEITSMICIDSGNAAFGKAIQFLSAAISLWICIPLFTELLSLVEGILGAA